MGIQSNIYIIYYMIRDENKSYHLSVIQQDIAISEMLIVIIVILVILIETRLAHHCHAFTFI